MKNENKEGMLGLLVLAILAMMLLFFARGFLDAMGDSRTDQGRHGESPPGSSFSYE